MALTLERAIEQAFTTMSGAQSVNYITKDSDLIARHTKVGGKILYDFTLRRGNGYYSIRTEDDDVRYRIATEKEIRSLKVVTQQLPRSSDAVVTTILNFPLSLSEMKMNERVREAAETGFFARQYLKEHVNFIENFHSDIVGLGLEVVKGTHKIGYRMFELTVNNATEDIPEESASKRKPTIVLLREFGLGEICGLKACASSNHVKDLESPLSAQIKMFNDYLV